MTRLHGGFVAAHRQPGRRRDGARHADLLKDGDTSTCTIESIGTLYNPVKADK